MYWQKPVFIMSIRILHVHVHPHALSATVASPNDEDRDGGTETGMGSQKERGHTQCGMCGGVCATGHRNKELVESLALNLILISPEWLGLFSPAFYLFFVLLFFFLPVCFCFCF